MMKKLIGISFLFLLVACNSEEKKTSAPVEEPKKEDTKIMPSDVELGTYSFIEIGVKGTYDASRKFYQTLGFQEIPNQFEDTSLIMLSDNSLKLVLNKGSIAPAMLVYMNPNMDTLKAKLKEQGILYSEPGADYIQIKSPDGAHVAILDKDPAGMFEIKHPNMMEMMQTNDIGNPGALPNPKLGIFGEFSHQVRDVEKAMQWWAKVGLMGSGIMEFGYKFAILMDRCSVVGVHEKQDNKWIGSAITYFATDQEVRIEQLKKEIDPEMIRETQQLGPGSAIIRSPEGNLIFAFKL
ncbi:MAG: hypothetical protein KDC84_08680 [Crocinitomicaceae bacterium]|nr:hypothetical protein [Crocinitomicaceae bacterium]